MYAHPSIGLRGGSMKIVFHGLSITPRDTVAIRPLKKSVNKATDAEQPRESQL
jgi:hypothetical protein